MAKGKKRSRRYIDDERASALAALAANAGNVEKTARQIGIPAKTLANWAKGVSHPEAAKAGDQKKGPLADKLEEVAWKLAEAIPERIAATPLEKLALSLGIVIDKMRLLREQPTAISKATGNSPDDLKHLTDAELAERIADARRRAGAA